MADQQTDAARQTEQQRQAAEAQAWRAQQDAQQNARDNYLKARLSNTGA